MAQLQQNPWLADYLAKTTAGGSLGIGERSQDYLKGFADVATSIIGTSKGLKEKSTIDKIIAEETAKAGIKPGMTPVTTDANGNLVDTGEPGTGEINYRALERRLLPYDRDLAMRYGELADKQEAKAEDVKIKREAILARTKIEQDKALEKQQALTNKFDLNTEEGKLAWKNQFNKIQAFMWQPGFSTAEAITVQEPIKSQLNNLVEQAKAYPELLSSVGISSPKIVDKTEIVKSPEFNNQKAMIDNAFKNNPLAVAGSYYARIDAALLSPEEKTELKSYVNDLVGGKAITKPATAIETAPEAGVNHQKTLSDMINKNAYVNKLGVLNSPVLINLVDQYAYSNLGKMDKKNRDEIVNNAKEFIKEKKQQAADDKQQQIAATQRAKEDQKYQAAMNQDAYKALQNSPEYVSYKATNDAVVGYNVSNKDAVAKRKLVYDYIKSYNTGTVLDSELNSTIGGISGGAGLVTAIKNKLGLEALNTITDAQINSIVSNMQKGLETQKKNVDKKVKELETTYGAKITISNDKTFKKHNASEYPLETTNGRFYKVDKNGKRQYEDEQK